MFATTLLALAVTLTPAPSAKDAAVLATRTTAVTAPRVTLPPTSVVRPRVLPAGWRVQGDPCDVRRAMHDGRDTCGRPTRDTGVVVVNSPGAVVVVTQATSGGRCGR